MLTDCPPILRPQRLATIRLAKAFRAHDRAEAAFNIARGELDEAFSAWAAGESTNRGEARTMLERSGMIDRKRV